MLHESWPVELTLIVTLDPENVLEKHLRPATELFQVLETDPDVDVHV